MAINTIDFGYLRSLPVPVINAGVTANVPLNIKELDEIDFVNVIDIANTGDVDIEVYLDGYTSKAIRVLANTSKSVNGTRFRSISVKNIHATDPTVTLKVLITIQKEFGRAEENQLRFERGTA